MTQPPPAAAPPPGQDGGRHVGPHSHPPRQPRPASVPSSQHSQVLHVVSVLTAELCFVVTARHCGRWVCPAWGCRSGHWECVWSPCEDLPGCLSGGPSRAPSSHPETRHLPGTGVSLPRHGPAGSASPHTAGRAPRPAALSAAGFPGALCMSGGGPLSLRGGWGQSPRCPLSAPSCRVGSGTEVAA